MQLKTIYLTLARVKYNGDSIGRDIRIDVEVLDKFLRIDKRIKADETEEINSEIGKFETDQRLFQAEIFITVIEKDLLFKDIGTTKGVIEINTASVRPHQFAFEVEVRESRSFLSWLFWGGRKAIFEIVLEAIALTSDKDILIRQYTYKGLSGDEDYNRYDDIIKEVVRYWNSEFLEDTEPPKELLDPNLVKAICYKESRLGNNLEMNGLINIMQVGNPGDPSIKTLRGELPEYWIHNGKQILLKYDAKVESVKDSIYWGVRWLFHKAQHIGDDGKRHWRTWKEAVQKYGPNTKEYTDSVWHIYKNGIQKEKNNVIHLWGLILFLLLSTFLFLGYQGGVNRLKAAIFDSFNEKQQLQIQNIEIEYHANERSLFAAIIVYEKDWWEDLKVGVWKNRQIKWLTIKNPPTEQSILAARFIELDGFKNPILEVYGQTHMGNGDLRLYQMNDDGLSLLFNTKAVDIYYDSIWNPKNLQKYGYSICGETYEGGRLRTSYKDIDSDGTPDVVMSGQINVDCEKGRIANGIVDSSVKIRTEEVKIKEIHPILKDSLR